ncbi:MAG: DapH/DapD/GlmU-related protein [Ilumatobacter sp.]|uniref:acyltransferase n=1 Tax=Ilumatobacter sp. TaxID=1967498 RepID=UPI003C7820C7
MARTRTQILRWSGWNIGRGTVLAEAPRLIGSGPLLQRLDVGADVFVNVGNVWELSDNVSIGDRVAIGQAVMLLTSSHRIGSRMRRADELFTAPVVIGNGVWIGARSTVLPGVHIGEGALVAANTVVRHDVPANVLFAGNPGSVIRSLDEQR